MATDTSPGWMGPLPAAPGCDCHVCRPEGPYDGSDRRSIDTVLEHGWQVVLVSDDVACEDSSHEDHDHAGAGGPPFAYTVGLGHRAGHPELLVSGLDPEVMHRALNDVARRVLQGRRLAPGDALEDVLMGVPVAVETVSDDGLRETVTWSGWFHRRPPEALALVWPSTSGVFAWQPGAPDALDERQPPRWRVPMQHSGGLGIDPGWEFPVPPDRMAFTCSHVVDDGMPVLWVARESDETRGEDWSLHCGAAGHASDDMRVLHLAHLVRSAPSLRELAGLELGHQADRPDTDTAWVTTPLE